MLLNSMYLSGRSLDSLEIPHDNISAVCEQAHRQHTVHTHESLFCAARLFLLKFHCLCVQQGGKSPRLWPHWLQVRVLWSCTALSGGCILPRHMQKILSSRGQYKRAMFLLLQGVPLGNTDLFSFLLCYLHARLTQQVGEMTTGTVLDGQTPNPRQIQLGAANANPNSRLNPDRSS